MPQETAGPAFLITDDHWADPGGRTVDALKEFLSARLGTAVVLVEAEILTSVSELRDLVFGSLS